MANANKKLNAAVIKQMDKAYQKFAKAMTKLERQGDDLLKARLAEIDKEKIEETLKKLKNT